jgi:hypothetical protein
MPTADEPTCREPGARPRPCTGDDRHRAQPLPAGRAPTYPPPVTLAELSDELGIDPGDLTVMVTALGEHAVDELPDLLLADLLDVFDAKTRLRNWRGVWTAVEPRPTRA